MLKLEEIRKIYGSGDNQVHALKGVSIEFREAEFVSILGPSGCGKTSLLNIIGGLDRYTSGDLNIDGVSTTQFSDRDWDAYRNHTIGFVFQSYNLIGHQSVLDNVAIALTLSGVSISERRKRALMALESVGIADQAKKKPNQLSGGQMQRVAIARALVNNPKVILADEPTGALDSTTSVQIMDILRELSKERLVIMVTHNKELAEEYSTRIIRLADGSMVEDTDPIKTRTPKTGVTVRSADGVAIANNVDEISEEPQLEGVTKKRVKRPRTSMNSRTAFKLSLKNLLTKKTRTILTSVAGSIGIIGIALILSISNGMTAYINQTERGILAGLPIEITRSAWQFREGGTEHPYKPGYVRPNEPFLTTHFNHIGAEFLAFAEDEDQGIASVGRVTRHYETALNVLFWPQNRSAPFHLGWTAQSALNHNVELIELPHEDMIRDFFDPMATYTNWDYTANPDAIPLTLVMNSSNQVPRNIALLLFGEERMFSFDEVLGTEFRLALNHLKTNNSPGIYGYNASQNVFYIDTTDANLVAVYNSEEQSIPMYIQRIVRPNAEANFIPVTPGLAFPQTLRGEIARHEATQAFIDDYVRDALEIGLDQTAQAIALAMLNNTMPTELNLINELARPATRVLENLYRQQTIFGQIFNSLPFPIQLGLHTAAIGFDLSLEVDSDPILKLMIDAMNNYIQTIPNLQDLRIVIPSLVAGVNIYASSFENKLEIEALLQSWNDNPDNDPIYWTDFVGLMLDVIREITGAVAIVLIAISAVSLVVSTLMIGIITYVSVLERTKEIGILRAIGARKKDIRRVFSAETIIIGLTAGVIGIAMALLLTIPVNMIVYALVDVAGVAVVPIWGALGLIAISCALTFISGLIPSRIAARKDPVVALRSE